MNVSEILKRPYARMVLPDADGTFTAEIVEFPGCIASGDNAADALANLDEVAADWIAAAVEQGQDIPEPVDASGYSGKLVLRMPKGLHKRAALFAERDGVSLNQFIVASLAEAVGERAKSVSYTVQPQAHIMPTNVVVSVGIGTALVSQGEYVKDERVKWLSSSSGNLISLPVVPVREKIHA